jgi:hypothetical protein
MQQPPVSAGEAPAHIARALSSEGIGRQFVGLGALLTGALVGSAGLTEVGVSPHSAPGFGSLVLIATGLMLNLVGSGLLIWGVYLRRRGRTGPDGRPNPATVRRGGWTSTILVGGVLTLFGTATASGALLGLALVSCRSSGPYPCHPAAGSVALTVMILWLGAMAGIAGAGLIGAGVALRQNLAPRDGAFS